MEFLLMFIFYGLVKYTFSFSQSVFDWIKGVNTLMEIKRKFFQTSGEKVKSITITVELPIEKAPDSKEYEVVVKLRSNMAS